VRIIDTIGIAVEVLARGKRRRQHEQKQDGEDREGRAHPPEYSGMAINILSRAGTSGAGSWDMAQVSVI
jgi:hypothetical protein